MITIAIASLSGGQGKTTTSLFLSLLLACKGYPTLAIAFSNHHTLIQQRRKNKGQIGSGDQLRRFFYGDLLPLGVQPGGAGMVVNLYNKANDVTFSYCATYDVIVAVKKGKVPMFPVNEVK